MTAQAELRRSYVNGGPGTVISGFVWLAAALVVSRSNVATGFIVLFFGGMTIFPIATLVVRGVFRRGPPSPENPGGRIVIETVFPMIGGLLAAWLLVPHRPEVVFPVAAIAVGAHYFGFRTAYGSVVYWVLAAVMCLVGLASIFMGVPDHVAVPYVIAAIEIAFGVWLTWTALSGDVVRPEPSPAAARSRSAP